MATAAEQRGGWRNVLPAGVRPYTEAAPLASLFASIRNAPAVMRGEHAATALGIHAPDARTVTIELTQPTALLERLVLPIAAPIRRG